MIDNTYYQTISVAEKSTEGIALSTGNKQAIPWHTPQAQKLSKADLHIHSTYSDAIPTIEQILKHTELNTDLDVIAITDHNVIDGSLRARDLWANASYRFDFIVGEEISTNEGHLLALFIEKHIPSHLSMERSIDLIHANKDLWLDGIETWNAGLCGIYANRVTVRVNRQFYGWSEVGNSDAHTLSAIGRACTLFQGSTALDVRTAIQAGLSTPGGKIWHVNDFLALASFHINKRRSARREPAALKITRWQISAT